jgi:hypothetical protein
VDEYPAPALARLMGSFNRLAKPECPSCGRWTTWITDDPAATRIAADDVLALVCEKCGFIRLHSIGALSAAGEGESPT